MSTHRRKKKKYVPHRPVLDIFFKPKIADGIKLNNLKPLQGFATMNTLAGEVKVAPILVRACLTSDESEFHLYMKQISGIAIENAKKSGIALSIDSIVDFLLIMHSDGTGHLYLDGAGRTIEIIPKHPVQDGKAVYLRDIADIRRMKYNKLNLTASDKIVVCFKIGWKFGMFFDFSGELDTDRMECDLATLYKRLRYQQMYEALSDEVTVQRMTQAGWFPFIEVMGGDFEPLMTAYRNNFNIQGEEQELVKKFTHERIDRIADRWWKNSALIKHKTVLNSGLESFKGGDAISTIKIIMTEIEGVLADDHLAEKDSIPKIDKLLQHAIDKGIKKVGTEASLYFPSNFLEYLQKVTFANFNRNSPVDTGASRHTVGHGFAGEESYTLAHALQAILTLDQIVFYL